MIRSKFQVLLESGLNRLMVIGHLFEMGLHCPNVTQEEPVLTCETDCYKRLQALRNQVIIYGPAENAARGCSEHTSPNECVGKPSVLLGMED